MNDDELLALVADAVRVPVPASLLDGAYASRAWTDIDATLAQLIEDSTALAGTAARSAGTTRHLVFECEDGVVDITVSDDQQRLVVRTNRAAQITIQYHDGSELIGPTHQTEASIDLSSSGPVRLLLATNESRWRTGWFNIAANNS